MTNTSKTRREGSVDTLRGLAAMLVLFHHIELPFRQFALGDFGRIGVLLFFIISGYCIFLSLLNSSNTSNSYKNLYTFLIRRLFRLYPIYWVSVLAIAIFTAHTYDLVTIILNFTMIQYAFSVGDINGVYWTLFIEIIFYFFISILLICGIQINRKTALSLLYGFLSIAIILAAVRNITVLPIPFAHVVFISTFFLGGVFYFNAKEKLPAINTIWHGIIFVLAILLISYFVYADTSKGSTTMDYNLLSYFGNYLIAVTIFIIGTLFIPVSTSLTTYLGLFSYGIYLFQGIVIELMPSILKNFIIAKCAWAICVTIFVSGILHYVVERPSIQYGRLLLKYFEKQNKA
ncbi:MAG: acyltransferase [Pseudomonadota bacterium]|nr:acyltransferase [Pseudomonadota bacterium]